jgi:hypothetical protein
MTQKRSQLLAGAMLACLAGCSFADSTLWPTLSGDDPRGRAAAQSLIAPVLSPPKPASSSPGSLRTDLVGLQSDLTSREAALADLRQSMGENERTVGRILLTLGRTPGNASERAAQTSEAQLELGRSSDGISRLAGLSSLAASDSARASYIAQAARAAETQPDLDDKVRSALVDIERDAGVAGSHADRIVSEIASTLAERSRVVADQRRQLASVLATAPALAQRLAERRPLVTIRFDRPDTPFDKDLRYAIGQALERRPNATFDIVAVAPAGTAPAAATAAAKRNMEGVVQAMSGMGVSPERLILSARTQSGISSDEVRVFVR